MCPSCDRTFRGPRRKEIFKTHYSAIHLHIKKYVCSYCTRRFAQNGARKRHELTCKGPGSWNSNFQIEIVGTQPNATPAVCRHCKKQFDSLRSRSSHEWRCSDRFGAGWLLLLIRNVQCKCTVMTCTMLLYNVHCTTRVISSQRKILWRSRNLMHNIQISW